MVVQYFAMAVTTDLLRSWVLAKARTRGMARAKARTGQRACAFGWTGTEWYVQMWVAAGAAQLCAAA